jgi:hypothetical protein
LFGRILPISKLVKSGLHNFFRFAIFDFISKFIIRDSVSFLKYYENILILADNSIAMVKFGALKVF